MTKIKNSAGNTTLGWPKLPLRRPKGAGRLTWLGAMVDQHGDYVKINNQKSLNGRQKDAAYGAFAKSWAGNKNVTANRKEGLDKG